MARNKETRPMTDERIKKIRRAITRQNAYAAMRCFGYSHNAARHSANTLYVESENV